MISGSAFLRELKAAPFKSQFHPSSAGNAGGGRIQRLGCGFGSVLVKKGGGGVFFAGIASYVVDGVDVGRWLPVCFCALLRHFSQRFGEGRAAWTGLDCGYGGLAPESRLVPSEPETGLAASTIFRIFSCIVFALRRTNSIVRFWGLIACRIRAISFGRLVFCFVGFSGRY